MPTQVQFRRGTTAQNNSFTGAAGELSINTSNSTIRVHDGSTAGGSELATVASTSSATNLTTGTLNSARLPASGVAAATYGNATNIPSITVDALGRITSASNVAISATVANTQITGLITSGQIASVANTQITGLITSGQIASVANTQITGTITAAQLQNTGVAATTYGGASSIPAITVDAQGRITSASNVAVTAGLTAGKSIALSIIFS
jgi:hypothetical protein